MEIRRSCPHSYILLSVIFSLFTLRDLEKKDRCGAGNQTFPRFLSAAYAQEPPSCNFKDQINGMILSIPSSKISLTALLDGNTTLPEIKARDWLVNDSRQWCSESFVKKKHDFQNRYNLALFYYTLNGDKWTECSAHVGTRCTSTRYLDGADECLWFGNTCDEDKNLVKISLSANNLEGTLPHLLSEFPFLASINLDSNSLRGSIPPSLASLKNLNRLDLDNNKLNGTIPAEIFDLSKLEILDIDKNFLTGTISSKISKLTLLSYISIKFNKFTGTIPQAIMSLTKLKIFLLEGNKFSGNISDRLCDLFEHGELKHLHADCVEPLKKQCVCCTRCFPHT
mmetsp:Transcript_14135/g.28180  ORF Transcript_14135/g.28180 Transcript_14135/m.28180 type:complete len:339 (-) Transcript_14135:31-1047(-)